MSFIPAKCTQCGANIEVDDSHEAGICKYCGTAFITEKAINNYNISIQNATLIAPNKNVDNLRKLAYTEYGNAEYDNSYNYCNEILEMMPDDGEAIYLKELIQDRKKVSSKKDNRFLPSNISEITKVYINYLQSEKITDKQYASDKIIFALDEWFDLVRQWYRTKKREDITNGKVVNQTSYAGFINTTNSATASIMTLCKYMLSLTEVSSNLKTKVKQYALFGIDILSELTKKYSALDDSYSCYTLRGPHEQRCYEDAEHLKTILLAVDGNYTLPSNLMSKAQGGTGVETNGCYIATCVYGSYDCPEVWTLRRFRDYTLDETYCGRLFIKCYYAISPTIVKWFGHTEWFKTFWKKRLDAMVRSLKAKGIKDTEYTDKY